MTDTAPAGATAGTVSLANSDWLSIASFLQPTHIVQSGWLEHAPFAAWLMDASRPRTVAELGTHNGYSYFVWCEMITRLGLDSRAWAIDSWEGDDQAGFYGEEVFELVRRTNARYASFSTLLRGYFADLVDKLGDHSIDLLHIDGRHGYEDVKADFEAYRGKLSSRGIVLFHDIAELQDGFGVHRLWSEVSGQFPSFAFEHGHGLGVLFVGTDRAPRIDRFIESSERSAGTIRQNYAELGARMTERFAVIDQAGNVPGLRALAQDRAAHLEVVQAEATQLRMARDAAEAASRRAAEQLREVLATRSWWLTRPLRSVRSRLPW